MQPLALNNPCVALDSNMADSTKDNEERLGIEKAVEEAMPVAPDRASGLRKTMLKAIEGYPLHPQQAQKERPGARPEYQDTRKRMRDAITGLPRGQPREALESDKDASSYNERYRRACWMRLGIFY
jgi:hypothetical protein